jgi:hypothetical protein
VCLSLAASDCNLDWRHPFTSIDDDENFYFYLIITTAEKSGQIPRGWKFFQLETTKNQMAYPAVSLWQTTTAAAQILRFGSTVKP